MEVSSGPFAAFVGQEIIDFILEVAPRKVRTRLVLAKPLGPRLARQDYRHAVMNRRRHVP
jgi:hypothetical protein